MESLGLSDLGDLPDLAARRPEPLPPVIIDDYRTLTAQAISDIARCYLGEHGVAHFIVQNPEDVGSKSHPMLDIAEQLSNALPLRFPVDHPMEGHPEAVSRFGPADGTLKIYDLETRDGLLGYREQAETSEQFDAHNDGLGYAGAVEAFMLYADFAPLWGDTRISRMLSCCRFCWRGEIQTRSGPCFCQMRSQPFGPEVRVQSRSRRPLFSCNCSAPC